MDYQLTVPAILRRAESLFGTRRIASRSADGSITAYAYADLARRARRLAGGLGALGVRRGDRVGTLCWNQPQHLEAYFAVPGVGAVLHTLNPRLPLGDLSYVIEHAADRVLIVDEALLPLYERLRTSGGAAVEHLIVAGATDAVPPGMVDLEALIAAGPETELRDDLSEADAAALCYSSGTTGRPKGVIYSHRAIVLHSMGCAMVDSLAISQGDVVLPLVPMFHVNAWGLPYTSALVGAAQVLPGPHLDAERVLELLECEGVTVAAAVPTVWLPVLDALDRKPGRWRLHEGLRIVVGGSAAPRTLIAGFDRHGVRVVHGWGMTETTPVAVVGNLRREFADASPEIRLAQRTKQGLPVPLVEVRARGDAGLIRWDGEAMGELEVRGPWVTSGYYASPEGADRFTADGWFKTGDIVSIDGTGYVEIRDRDKDLIKSGGEWISSVALESALMGHPSVAEAAVIAVPDPRWQERPLAVVVLKDGCRASASELLDHLRPLAPAWWLPDAIELVDALPRTATGKIQKNALRERFKAR